MLIWKVGNVSKSKGDDPLLIKETALDLQEICNEMVVEKIPKQARKKLYKEWRENDGIKLKHYEVDEDDVLVLLAWRIRSVLGVIYEVGKGQADGPTYKYGVYCASKTATILMSEILGQKDIDEVFHELNEYYGLNLDFEWWLGFLNSEPFKWYEKAFPNDKKQKKE